MRILAGLFLTVFILSADDRCTPPLELREFINSLPADNRARREIVEERLKGSTDFTLHRIFLDTAVYERKPIRERYLRLLESNANSIDHQYLQARSLLGSNTPETLRLYAQILEKDPEYPWVHLSQLEIYRSPAFRDRAKLAASFATLQRVCPTSLLPYSFLNEIAETESLAGSAAKLRNLLKDATTPAELRLYGTLWSVEFRLRPGIEHDDERKRMAEDLNRLLPFYQADRRLQSTIENGAKLTENTALQERLAKERKPDSAAELMEQSNAWVREHPRPKPGATAEIKRAYSDLLLPKTAEWRKMDPDEAVGYLNHVVALIYRNAPKEEIGKAGDEFLKVIRRKEPVAASWINSLIRYYVDNGVLLDRIPALCDEVFRLLDDPEAVPEFDLERSPRYIATRRYELVNWRNDAMMTLAMMHQKLGQPDQARAVLWQAADTLAAKAPKPDESDYQILQTYKMARYSLVKTSAEIAEQDGRKLDALNGYREALIVWAIGKEDLLARQRKLWKDLGGSDEGWQQWTKPVVESAAKAPTPPRPEGSAEKRKLPPLAVKDLDGNPWTLERLAGKTTIAAVWATWCEPCRAELPYITKLAARLKGRDDVQVITLNTDDNIAVAQRFTKLQAYTFPVLWAKQYAEDLMTVFAIPRTWIIKDGVITKEYQGFGANGDQWVETVIKELH